MENAVLLENEISNKVNEDNIEKDEWLETI